GGREADGGREGGSWIARGKARSPMRRATSDLVQQNRGGARFPCVPGSRSPCSRRGVVDRHGAPVRGRGFTWNSIPFGPLREIATGVVEAAPHRDRTGDTRPAGVKDNVARGSNAAQGPERGHRRACRRRVSRRPQG